jgi:hypothetical protein
MNDLFLPDEGLTEEKRAEFAALHLSADSSS